MAREILPTDLGVQGFCEERNHAGKNWENKVVVSDRLITGQSPQSAASLGKKIVELAKTLR